MKLALAILALSTAAHAAVQPTLPDAPKPHADRIEWALLGTDVAIRLTDAYSTRLVLSQPHTHEQILPDCISHHTAAMYGYSAGVVGFNWLMARELKHHGHPKLARLVYVVDIAVEAPTLSNFAVYGHAIQPQLGGTK